MRINITGGLVDDQVEALRFYTDVLGFLKKHDSPMDGEDRWLTVVSPRRTRKAPNCCWNPAATSPRSRSGRPRTPTASRSPNSLSTTFRCERLRGLGVRVTQEPTIIRPVTTAVLDDLRQLALDRAHDQLAGVGITRFPWHRRASIERADRRDRLNLPNQPL
ncbi:VOC family protein [Cryobacterium sp. Y62]|uniref:VOC family protein n=1 Tax=Cryobacterium sp. Y62 TaxID=2048284 RepID=UPI0034CDEC34